jgi:CxxC-x17-CxxC domain-containing protein
MAPRRQWKSQFKSFYCPPSCATSRAYPKTSGRWQFLRVPFHCAWGVGDTHAEGGVAMSGSDLLLTCSDCGQEFTFTAGEQQFFQERGYSSPRRCKPCRQAKQSGGGGGHAGSYSQHAGGYSGGAGGGTSAGTTVVCASCGQTTTVPFEPRGDRPVYCKSCYRPKQGGGGGGRQNRSDGGGGNRDRDRRRY